MSDWNFLQISMAAPKKAEIVIYDRIGPKDWDGRGVDASQVKKDLDSLGELDEITLRINSPGGNVFHGLAIYNLLATHKAKKVVQVDGVAASAASLIAMAGDEIVMNTGSLMMIHETSMAAYGRRSELEKALQMIDMANTSIVGIYQKRTGLPEQEIRDLLRAETWMTDQQAVEKKFAHRVNENVKAVAATLEPQQFSNAPDWVKARCVAAPTGSGKQETPSMTTQTPAPAPVPATAPAASTQVAPVAVTAATPAAASPAAPVAPEAASPATAPDAVARERERSSKIVALCAQAGHSELAAKWIEDPSMSVEQATSQLFAQVCAERAPLATAAGSSQQTPADPTAEYKKEYAANKQLYAEMDLSEEQYVESCLVSAGEKKLTTAAK